MNILASGALATVPVDEAILIDRERDGIVTLTLNRPGQYNALSEALLAALQTKFDALAGRSTLRCVILAAAGKGFCAGHDLREMRSREDESYFRDLFARCSSVMQAIRACPVPVIAQVQGLATAAGCQLVAACDLAIAAREARFAVSGINVGLFCSTPAVALSRNIGPKAAFDMLVTGRFIDADEACRLGLVNKVVSGDQLETAVDAYADEIAAKSPDSIRIGKQMFYKQAEMPLAEAYRFAGETMACNIMQTDAKTGIDAFLNKRKTSA
jgi:enoyl-CoA hydratase/carnithine racemase